MCYSSVGKKGPAGISFAQTRRAEFGQAIYLTERIKNQKKKSRRAGGYVGCTLTEKKQGPTRLPANLFAKIVFEHFDMATFETGQRPRVLGFRYYYRGAGAYEVWLTDRLGRDVLLGWIRTIAPIALAVNPGKWRAEGVDDAFDSMNSSAERLLESAERQ